MPKQDAKAKRVVVLVVGRWQPFHLGHLDLVRRAIREYGDIILGIGSSNKSNTWENPFTLNERIIMILSCLKAEGLSDRVDIVPIPDVGNDALWLKQVEGTLPEIGLLITGNDWCRRIFHGAGYNVLPPKFFRKEFYNGTKIREDICSHKDGWRKKVHPTVAGMIDSIPGLDERFRTRECKGKTTTDGRRQCKIITSTKRG